MSYYHHSRSPSPEPSCYLAGWLSSDAETKKNCASADTWVSRWYDVRIRFLGHKHWSPAMSNPMRLWKTPERQQETLQLLSFRRNKNQSKHGNVETAQRAKGTTKPAVSASYLLTHERRPLCYGGLLWAMCVAAGTHDPHIQSSTWGRSASKRPRKIKQTSQIMSNHVKSDGIARKMEGIRSDSVKLALTTYLNVLHPRNSRQCVPFAFKVDVLILRSQELTSSPWQSKAKPNI